MQTPTTGKFLSEESKKDIAKEQNRARKRREKIAAVAGLILGSGMMMAMILNGLIDNVIGMLFLIGISAYFGYHMK